MKKCAKETVVELSQSDICLFVKNVPFQDRPGKRRNPFLAESSGAKEGVEVLHWQGDNGVAVLRRIVLVRPEHPVGNDRVGAA